MKRIISMVLSLVIVFTVIVPVTVIATGTISDKITIPLPTVVTNNVNMTVTQTITINGTGITEAENKDIGIKVWKLGKNQSLLDSALLAAAEEGVPVILTDFFAFVSQTTADANGNFTFEFPFSETVGTYKVDIKIPDQPIITKDISTVDINAIQLFITTINSSAVNSMTVSAFDDVIEHPKYYGVDLQVFNTILNKTEVLDATINLFKANYNAIPRITNTTTVLKNTLDEQTLIQLFKETNDGTSLKAAFEFYENAGLVDVSDVDSINTLYNSYTDKETVFTSLGNKTYTSIDMLEDAFKERVFLKALSANVYSDGIDSLISTHDIYLNFSTENELSAKASYTKNTAVKNHVCDTLNTIKTSIDSISAFKSAFVNAVGTYVPPTKNDQQTGGYSGGSGWSSVSVGGNLIATNPPAQTVVTFKDIAGHWAQEAVSYLSTLRIVSGNGDGNFYPTNPITRAEYVKMIVEAYGLMDKNSKVEFEDVEKGQWFYPYVASMVKKGYIVGDELGLFYPNAHISRQDMAVILYRVLQGKNLVPLINTLEVKFDDFDSVAAYAQNSVSYMSNMELINGSDGLFRPKNTSTRAEAAQIIFNALMEVGN